ncbi:MAG TPA: glycine zipper 2TM domain-containing protein, partial [Burkholderiaceae bacterium]
MALQTAQAAQIDDFARVISATPQMARYNRPVEECHTEYVQTQQEVRRNNGGGAVLGALVGGVLGNQVGGGSGRAAATAAGVIGGAVAGDRIANGGTQAVVVGQQPVRQCRMVDRWEERPNGYA